MSNQPTPEQTATGIVTDVQNVGRAVVSASTAIATATVWTAIVGFFTALPGIIALIQGFMKWVNSVSGNNPQALISDLGQTFNLITNAKTVEEKNDAAKKMADIIHRLPT